MMSNVFASLLLLYFFQCSAEKADFHNNRILNTITFGSCNKHDKPQPLWDKVIDRNPDLWMWLGDAVYADTRVIPFIWVPSALETMRERFVAQKKIPKYQKLLENTPVIGIWDDHDYGNNNGGKSYYNRLQSQNIFLDFLDEPQDSVRRTREGLYASYTYGIPGKMVKVIFLDVRSHFEGGSSCDILGADQWAWLKGQLDDDSVNMILIGTGLQVLSDIPFIEKWMQCRPSLDRLIWLTQQYPRVIFLSGDVHFSEVSCYNATSTGYPLYEITSSGLTHSCSASLLPSEVCHWTLKTKDKIPLYLADKELYKTDGYPIYDLTSSGMSHTCSFPKPHWFCVWLLENVVASRYRVSKVVTDLSFGSISIDWNSPINVKFSLVGVTETLSEVTIALDDLSIKSTPSLCPTPIEQPNWYWKRVFWFSSISLGIVVFLIALRATILALRWISMVLLKDLDTKIKHRLKKLKTQLAKITPLKNNRHTKQTKAD